MLSNSNKDKQKEAGFTLIESVVAIFVITIGLLGTAAAITYALEYSSISKNSSNAKQIITSMIEEVESLRNTRRLRFAQIANVADVDNTDAPNVFSGFSDGMKEVSMQSGPDGVTGTDDDLRDSGPDSTYGTPDDFDNPGFVKGGYTREIIVTEMSKFVKKIEVKVRYVSGAGKTGELRGVCYLNNDARLSQN